MPDKPAIDRYRHWYRRLLCFYPRSYRERFVEGMDQTFHDLCRERSRAGRRLFGFVLWLFIETSAAIIRENMRVAVMENTVRRLGVWAVVVAALLMIPVVGKWPWTGSDSVFGAVVLFGSALVYELIARRGSTFVYRAAVGLAVATGLVLLWINAAVGIIGDGPVNVMYLGVLAVGLVGTLFARLQPRGMALALFATAVAQMLVPVIALVLWKAGWQELLVDRDSPHPPFSPGVGKGFGLNAFFAALWIGTALLFRRAGGPRSPVRPEERESGTSVSPVEKGQ
jgi:hypothetical protein